MVRRALLHAEPARLLELPDHVVLYPSHYGGSVCGRGLSGNPFSSIGFERAHNAHALLRATPDAFADAVLADAPPPPADQKRIVAANRAGHTARRGVSAPQLGLRANAAQFTLLVALNALVGAMVGLERSVLPLVGEAGLRAPLEHRDPRLRRRVRRGEGAHESRRRASSPSGSAASGCS